MLESEHVTTQPRLEASNTEVHGTGRSRRPSQVHPSPRARARDPRKERKAGASKCALESRANMDVFHSFFVDKLPCVPCLETPRLRNNLVDGFTDLTCVL